MNITVLVDQARALRAGVNAPSHRVTLDIDPAELTQQERDVLAVLLRDGHDTTKEQIAHPLAPDEAPKTGYGRRLTVVSPDCDGLRSGLLEVLTWHATERAKLVTRRVKADAKIDEVITAERATRTQLVTLRDGKIVDAYLDGPTVVEISFPVEPAAHAGHASAEAIERLAKAKSETREEALRIREAARPELERLAAAEAERKALAEAEYEALKARVDPALLARCEAGFGRPHELHDAMRKIALGDANQEVDPWLVADGRNSHRLTSLSDPEFAALQVARQAAPKGATVEPALIWQSDYRDATEQELADGLGDEDDEIEERLDERRVLLIEWTIGDRLEVTAVVPLPAG